MTPFVSLSPLCRIWRRGLLLVPVFLPVVAWSADPQTMEHRFSLLVFSKTNGFRHSSIPAGVGALKALGAKYGFGVDATEDAAEFADATLAQYKVVLFLNTTGP